MGGVVHWRQMTDGSEWLTHLDLLDGDGKPREFTVTIEKVTAGVVVGEGGKKSKKPVLHFRGAKKPYAAGATVCTVIEGIAGSPEPARWAGVQITLFVGKTEITRDGKRQTVGCIRVKRPRANATDQQLPSAPATELPSDSEAPPADAKGGTDGPR